MFLFVENVLTCTNIGCGFSQYRQIIFGIPMDQVFANECTKYIELLEKYLEDSTSLEDVVMQAKKVDLVQEVGNKDFLAAMKQKIFSFVKSEHEKLMALDSKIRKKNDSKVVEVDMDVLLTQAERFCSVAEPPYGYERSLFFKASYPTQEMMNIRYQHDDTYKDS